MKYLANQPVRHFALTFLTVILVIAANSSQAQRPEVLTLQQAEQTALSISPEIQQLHASQQALQQKAIAADQLPDPQLAVSASNVPSDNFSFTAIDMTVIGIGLQQAFPAGHSLAAKSAETQAMAMAKQKAIAQQTIILLKNVRDTWLDLYYWMQAAQVIRQTRFLYEHLLKVTESQYSVAKDTLSNVLQVKLELSRLDNQEIQIQQQIDTMHAQLARWIGPDEASKPLANALPDWPGPPPLGALQTQLLQHPIFQVDAANIKAARESVDLAKQQYKPAWSLGVSYGIRQGESNGTPRSNLVSAQVGLSLPVFPANRQSRQLKASNYELEAAELQRQADYRDLVKELDTQYATWHRLSERETLYTHHLVPEATQNSQAALLAYQNATDDLTTVLRAYSNELTARLEQLQIQVERAKTRAALFYLEGVNNEHK